MFFQSKITSFVVLTTFLFHQVAYAQDGKSNPTEAVKRPEDNKFYLSHQSWGTIPGNFKEIDKQENLFKVKTSTGDIIFKIIPKEKNGLLILNLSSHLWHKINLPTRRVSFSKNYLFILSSENRDERPGFHLIRLSDLLHFGSKSALPVFHIYTDPSQGLLKKILVTHNTSLEEDQILLVHDDKEQNISFFPFKEIEQLLKFQMIQLAYSQVLKTSNVKELHELIDNVKKEFVLFFENLTTELKNEGGESATKFLPPGLLPQLKKEDGVDLEKATPEALAQVLMKVNEDPKIESIKRKYAEQLSGIVDRFNTQFSELINRVEITPFEAKNDSEELQLTSDLLASETEFPDMLKNPEKLAQDKETALTRYAYIGAGALVFTVALPRLFGMTLTDMCAGLSQFYYFKFTSPLTNGVIKFLGKKSVTGGIQITGDQLKRQFFQVSADTLTVLASELLMRPWYRHVGEENFKQAILVDEPFTEMHTLYWQKNFLYRVLYNQIIGTLGGAAGLAIMERDLNLRVTEYITNLHLEQHVGQQFRRATDPSPFVFTDKERRQLADVIGKDLNDLERGVAASIKVSAPALPNPTNVVPRATLEKIETGWIQSIEQTIAKERGLTGFTLTEPVKTLLRGQISTKLVEKAGEMVREQFGKFAHRGFLGNFGQATSMTIQWAMEKIIGGKLTYWVVDVATISLKKWFSLFEPAFWNALYVQTPIRGGFSISYLITTRLLSLFFLCPFYVATYGYTKKKIGIASNKGEFLYGLAYGVVTSTVCNYVYVNFYEKHIAGTPYEIEFRPFGNTPSEKKRK